MDLAPDFRLLDTLDESKSFLLVKALRNHDNHPVILKILKKEKATKRRQHLFRQEFEFLRSLNIDGVIRAISLEQKNDTQIIVLNDVDVQPLQKLRLSGEFVPDSHNLKTFLKFAIQLVETISELHAANIIHKCINPYNILFNPQTEQLQLFDFSQATQLPHESTVLPPLSEIDGNLSYISPEQSGRMNRSLDFRTDFYSLGITFYEMLTGQLPFSATTPLELIHCHLANKPQAPSQIEPTIPPVLSDIILKLMAKAAENRYQSASGLKHDLQICLDQLCEIGDIKPFTIGENDFSPKLIIPEKLFGREDEVRELRQAFERVSAGNKEWMLVAGYPGIGKTSLVQELHKPITQQKGIFITGKFDQYQKDIPYSALVNALSQLIQSLLTESEEQLLKWQTKLLPALGQNGQVLIDVVPQLEKIIGPQPAVPSLGAKETHIRFNLVFQKFIQVFCQPAHPLVIFLDDLQWADSTTFSLLESLMIASDISNLLLIGCYRNQEVNHIHPLMHTINILKEEQCVVNQVRLNPLTQEDIFQILTETLHSTREDKKDLASLITKKTKGNPFFINEFLELLYREDLLWFVSAEETHLARGWHWNMPEIEALDITDNVAELIGGKLSALPAESKQLLQIASCIGVQFDLATLSFIYEKSQTATYRDLLPAIREDFCLPLSSLEAIDDATQDSQLIHNHFKFLHDYLQQVTYDSMDGKEKKQVHLAIGRQLFQNLPSTDKVQIFGLVHQLNYGRELISDQTELNELAALNLQAGLHAKEATAYETALNYFQIGIDLLSDDCWQSNYELTLNLFVEAATITNLQGNFSKMAHFNDIILQQANSWLDKMPVYQNQIQTFKAEARLSDAVDTGIVALGLLGITIPQHPSKLEMSQVWQNMEAVFEESPIESLVDLPIMTNPEKLVAVDILSQVITAAWPINPDLCSQLILKRLNLLFEYGNTKASGAAYAAYGLHLRGLKDDIENSYRFGELALNIINKLDSREYQARTLYMVGVFIRHWKKHARESLPLFLEGYRIGLETGDVEFASYSASDYCTLAFLTGKNLVDLQVEAAVYMETLRKLKQGRPFVFIKIVQQSILNYQGFAENPGKLIGSAYDEETMLPLHHQAKDAGSLSYYYFIKVLLCYQFGLQTEALDNANLAKQYLGGARSAHYYVPFLYMYEALALLALYSERSHTEQKEYLEKVSEIQEKMERWSQYAPMNHLFSFYLIEAESNRVSGKNEKARHFYKKAMTTAYENNYQNEVALCTELAGKFYISIGKMEEAHILLQKSIQAYNQWGALAKVNELEKQYPHIIKTTFPSTLLKSIDPLLSQSLDMNTVFKVSQTLMSETDLSALLTKIMLLVIKTAGAQRGVIILEHQGTWKIEAEAGQTEESIAVLQSAPLSDAEQKENFHLPITIINYVINSGENVLLHNAAQEGLFIKDAYISANSSKSIFCMPLTYQTKMKGILYLENNLATDAFTPERVDILTVLSTQATISIENARLLSRITESEKRYRYLFNSGNDAVFVYKLTNMTLGKFVDVNQIACTRYGYSKEEFLTMTALDIVASGKSESLINNLLKLYSEKQIVFEATHITKSGKVIPVEMNSNLIELDGELAVFSIARNITKRKQTEIALKQHQERLEQLVEERTAELLVAKEAAEAANQAKSVFLASMSHELRTPLNSILGFAQILQQQPFDPETKSSLNTIQKSGEHLLTLINDSLDIAKIEAGKMELFPTWLQFPAFLDNVCDIIRARAKIKNLQFDLPMCGCFALGH